MFDALTINLGSSGPANPIGLTKTSVAGSESQYAHSDTNYRATARVRGSSYTDKKRGKLVNRRSIEVTMQSFAGDIYPNKFRKAYLVFEFDNDDAPFGAIQAPVAIRDLLSADFCARVANGES